MVSIAFDATECYPSLLASGFNVDSTTIQMGTTLCASGAVCDNRRVAYEAREGVD